MTTTTYTYYLNTVRSLFTAHSSQAEIVAFAAKERDTETGLSYFGSRYYNSDLSIWLSVDPRAAKYPSLSPYAYCANNPVKLVDPYYRLKASAFVFNIKKIIRHKTVDEVNIFYELQKGQKPNDSIRYKTITCQAGSVIFSVDSQGDVYPCQSFHFADFRLGNFLTQTLEEIYNSQIATMLRVSNDVEYKATCRECKLKYICAGGCAANTYALEGNILNYPQTMCPYYKAGALKRLKNVEFYRLLILLFMCFLTPIVRAQTPDSLLYKNALRLFADAQSICETDRGELWGENLWGPVLLVRDSDKIAFTNEPKLLPFSIKVDSLYCGILDSSVIVAGSAIRFMNMEVALVPLLSLSDSIMIQVFIHELYHRFQNNHFDMEEVVYDNAHIDTRIGRTLVLCELIELAKSLNCSVEDQHSHIKRAIEFRKWRWTLFPEKIKVPCLYKLIIKIIA